MYRCIYVYIDDYPRLYICTQILSLQIRIPVVPHFLLYLSLSLFSHCLIITSKLIEIKMPLKLVSKCSKCFKTRYSLTSTRFRPPTAPNPIKNHNQKQKREKETNLSSFCFVYIHICVHKLTLYLCGSLCIFDCQFQGQHLDDFASLGQVIRPFLLLPVFVSLYVEQRIVWHRIS